MRTTLGALFIAASSLGDGRAPDALAERIAGTWRLDATLTRRLPGGELDARALGLLFLDPSDGPGHHALAWKRAD